MLGADSKKIRTLDSVKVLNYIFSNYTKIDISNIIDEEFYKYQNYFSNNIAIEKSTDKPLIQLGEITNTTFPLQKSELNSISSEIYSLSKISTPIFANTKIGEINIKVDNEILLSSNIILENNLTRKTWQKYYQEILENFFNL